MPIDASDARLRSRPGTPAAPILPPGLHPLGLSGTRDGWLYVPSAAVPGARLPIAVLLHGAGGVAEQMRFVLPIADELELLILAPDSRGRTWDVIEGAYGPDVRAVDAALAHASARCAIDAARMAVGGFSDGASYALCLGLANGDLFRHVLACSPGFEAAPARVGRPAVFVSHGTGDDVLPVGRTSRRLVPALRRDGYDVTYREFDGRHEVPPSLAREALARV